MRTTLNIDPDLLDDVVEITGEHSKTRAVSKALDAYVRRARINELRAMAGKFVLHDTREEQRAAERRKQAFLDSLRGR
jgi:Arc/MetJ family transcription regulator